MRRVRFRHPVALAVALLALAVPSALAVFVATISNSGNSFQAAAVFPGAVKMASGTYTGDATAGRAIAAGFQPDLVIVKDAGNREGAARTSTMTGDATKLLGSALILQANDIQALTATGFTVGSGAPVNGNNRDLLLGRAEGLQPVDEGRELHGQRDRPGGHRRRLLPGGRDRLRKHRAARSAHALRGASRAYGFDSGTGITAAMSSLDADGFTVGTAPETNAAAAAYHYVAFNKMANSVDAGTYSGNATDNRNIATVGFQPEYMLSGPTTSTSRAPGPGQARPSLAGDSTLPFSATAAARRTGSRRFSRAGFQVGHGDRRERDRRELLLPRGPQLRALAARRHGPAVDRPGGAGDVRGARGAEEGDHGGDLVVAAHPAERRALAR